jgi:hypothetical protein
VRFARSAGKSDEEYARGIARGLDKVFEPRRRLLQRWIPSRHLRMTVEAEKLRVVVFSDLHRGTRDKADDFRRAQRAYRAALGWYLEHGYQLWLLGDVEELWENSLADVMREYRAVLELEQQFTAPGAPGLRRFYGNHDLDWSRAGRVDDHLREWIGGGDVIESLRLTVREGGEDLGLLFFVHGHQGTPGSDVFAGVSRIAVRVVWRAVQRSQGWLATTPADKPLIRAKHDRAMCAWATGRGRTDPPTQRPVLVAGHTHHPVFPGKPPTPPTREQIAELQAKLDAATDRSTRAGLRAQIELLEAELWEKPYDVPEIMPPCYFNTGCASFPDGDVTCLEISGEAYEPDGPGGKIRLMRWLDNDGRPQPKELAARPLREVLETVRRAPAG